MAYDDFGGFGAARGGFEVSDVGVAAQTETSKKRLP